MKIVIFLMTFSLYGNIGSSIEYAVGESVENYEATDCGSSLDNSSYSHDTIEGLLDEWENKGHTVVSHYTDLFAYGTDLIDSDMWSVGTDEYTDDEAHLIAIAAHGTAKGIYIPLIDFNGVDSIERYLNPQTENYSSDVK